MKKILLLSIFFCQLAWVSAQTGFVLHPDVVDTFFTATTGDPVGHGEVCNNGNETIELLWKMEVISAPFAWKNNMCDYNLCYDALVQECPDGNPVVLPPGECGILDVHISPMGFLECGKYLITVWEKGNPDNKATLEYIFNCTSSSNDYSNIENINVFPNPAKDYFQLSAYEPNTLITVNNIFGKKILSFSTREGKVYPLENIPRGMYMVNIQNQKGDLLKSVRLRKL